MKRAYDRTFPKAIILETVIEYPIVRSLAEMREMNNSTFWKIRPLPKRKKVFISSVTVGVRCNQQISEVLLPRGETELVQYIGREGAAGAVGE